MRAAAGFMQYRAGELAADRIIHLMGTLAGVVGSAVLVGIAAVVADRPTFSASLVYSVCLLTIFGCSAATISLPMQLDESFCANLIMPRSF